MMIIIADDLTGANDSGVQLSKQGIKTLVHIDPLNWENYGNNILSQDDVLVIDTETRDLNAQQAADAIGKIVKKLKLSNKKNEIYYKKIDSTLRGNIGQEVEILMDLLDKDLCILTPSFPQTNRITVGGYLLVNNLPLGLSQYYEGELKAWQGTYIPFLIQQQTNLPVGLVELKDVMKGEKAIVERIEELKELGKRIIIFDAVVDMQLRDIVKSVERIKSSILYCGSAGLVNHFSVSESRGFKNSYTPYKHNSPLLMIIGSRNKGMTAQIDYLSKKIMVSHLEIDIAKILTDKTSLEKYTKKALVLLENKVHLLIYIDSGINQQRSVNKILKKMGLSFRNLEEIIRDFLAKLTSNILKETDISNLFMTGGDTATGICKELNINSLLIEKEILPGIPLSSPGNKKNNDLRIVTKAGGFGKEDTLYQIVAKSATKGGEGL